MNFDFKRMLKFEHNVGEKEKKYRMIGGAALILVSIFTAKVVLLLLGMVLAITGYAGWCPAYSGLGKNTCATRQDTGEAEQVTSVSEQVTSVSEQVATVAEQEPVQEPEQQA